MDQSYNLTCCFLVESLFQIYVYSKILLFSILDANVLKTQFYTFINKVEIETYCLVLFNWNVAPVVDVSGSAGVGGTTVRLAATGAALDISDIIQFLTITDPALLQN